MNARQVNPGQAPVRDERNRRQRARNWAILLALAAFVLIVYVVTIVKLKDGRTVSGMVTNRTSATMTLGGLGDPVTVSLGDVSATELAPYSLMPEGLLESLDTVQRRNLIAYLMGEEQVPLPAPATP